MTEWTFSTTPQAILEMVVQGTNGDKHMGLVTTSTINQREVVCLYLSQGNKMTRLHDRWQQRGW